MNRENYKSLLKELKKIGFDDRIDEQLETGIRQCKSEFSFLYGTQPFLQDSEEEWLIYQLHFERKNDGSYVFKKCDAQLFFPAVIPHREILGIQTDILEQRLQTLPWETRYTDRTKIEHLAIDAAGESLSILRSDEQGKKISNLLISKYWPLFAHIEIEDMPRGIQYEKGTNLFYYDKGSNRFYLTYTFYPSEGKRLTDIEQMMKTKSEALIPMPPTQTYSLQGTGIKINPETQIEIGSGKKFYSIKEACSFLHSIDDILFNKKIMADNNAPWYLRKMTIIDNNDHSPVVSKIAMAGPNAVNKTTELFLLYELHDIKLSLSEFMQYRIGNSLQDGDLSQIVTQAQKKFTSLDPHCGPSQSAGGEQNQQARQHTIKRFPPGTGRKL
jgi:hypothetical protein